MNELAPRPSLKDWSQHGLVSLWDMINFTYGYFYTHLQMLGIHAKQIRQSLETHPHNNALMGPASMKLEAELKRHITSTIKITRFFAQMVESNTLNNLLSEIDLDLEYDLDAVTTANRLDQLKKALEVEYKSEMFYHYPREKGKKLKAVEQDWSAVLGAFPSSKYDVIQGIDAHACGHDTAAVFHMMRVAEVGLIRLAKDLKVTLKKDKPLSHAQWGEIIGEVEKRATAVLHSAQAGDEKDRALAFYNGSASHLRALKDRYRNVVMHSRRSFNEHEAGDAIFHTRSAMMTLAEKLSETSNRKVSWKL